MVAVRNTLTTYMALMLYASVVLSTEAPLFSENVGMSTALLGNGYSSMFACHWTPYARQ